MPSTRSLYLPPLYQDAPEEGRLILRDGSTAIIRVARPDDREMLREFFRQLSPESRRYRFFSASKPPPEEIDELCDSANPHAKLTLIVVRVTEHAPHLIAVGSYFREDEHTGEVALAVGDAFHGKGLGSLLLERLALLAARQGMMRFWAVMHADNRPMIEVFHRSGFELRERAGGDALEVECSLVPTAASAARSEWIDRMFTTASLRPFFQPKAVAVIGASRDTTHIGYRILFALVTSGFQGTVYPVNPNASVVSSIRAYATVKDIPDPVDLAIIVVPRDAVLGVVDDCAARGVRALIVISAGFAETGEDGRALQQRLVERVRGYGMRLIGPNCLGLVNTDPTVRLNASFSPIYPPEGAVAMLSQSGALGIAILALAKQKHLGLSHFVSVGNKADVSGNDLIQYWEQDPRTRVILLYLESFGNPRRFARIARRVSGSKPIVAVTGGRTSAGRRAASSHTAALASSAIAVDALFQQTGVIRAETLEEMFDVAAAFASQPLPRGRRVGLITNAGGPGILCADVCEAGGLDVAQLSRETMARLAEFLPSSAGLRNPVDMIASATPEQYRRTIATLLATHEIDALIVLYIPVGVVQLGAVIDGITMGVREGRAGSGADIPILACLMGGEERVPPLAVGDAAIPTYAFPEASARALCQLAAYARWRAKPQGRFIEFEDAKPQEAQALCQAALAARGGGWLGAEETRAVLTSMGLPVAPGGVARTVEEAQALARQLGFPVAVKLASRQIVHKTEHDAVRLNVSDAQGVQQAFEAIRDQLARDHQLEAMDGVIVQPMVRGGVEVMAGVVEDPAFGPLLAFGLGGIHVEILGDVVFRATPLTDRDAAEMVRGIRGFRLLEGYRGHPPVDLEAIEQVLLRVSRLVEEVPEMVELDLNPMFALPPGQGCQIVDARLRIERRK